MTLQQKKELTIVGVSTLYSIFFFLLVALVLQGYQSWSLVFTIGFVLAALLWVAIVAAATAFLPRHSANRYVLIVLSSLALLIVGTFSLAAFTGAFLLAIFLLVAQRTTYREVESRVAFSVYQIFGYSLKVVIVGLVVSLITLALPTVQDNVVRGTLTVPDEYIGAVLRPFTPLIEQYIPGYTPSSTVDDIVRAQIQQQQANLPPGFVIPSGQEILVRQELSRQLGIPLRGSETVPEVTAEYVNGYVRELTTQNAVIVVIVLLVVVLLALRAMVPLLTWPTVLILMAIVYLSQRVGLVSIMKTQVTVERLHL